MKPWLDDGDVRLYHGHVLEVLQAMPDGSVDCIITSPPYYGLRDYGTGRWEGGEATCDHQRGLPHRDASGGLGGRDLGTRGEQGYASAGARPERQTCGKCGARRVDHQIGLEETPAAYLATLVAVFREARRVLADHGTCWINLGDSYAGSPNSGSEEGTRYSSTDGKASGKPRIRTDGLPNLKGFVPAKNLLMMPARLAIALQDDGWILRSAITWCKRAPMPGSATDRPTTATEMVFMLTKKPRYWSDFDALRGLDGRNGNTLNYWILGPDPFTEWGETSRRVPVDADAVGDDIERIASPDCPVHGDSDRLGAMASGGERADGASSRSRRNGAHPDQAPLRGLADAASTRGQDRSADSSDSPQPACSSTATPHSTESHRRGVQSTCDGTGDVRTSDHTPYTSPSDASPEPDGSDTPGSSRTNGHTSRRCSCSYFRIVTEKTSHFATYPEELVRRCLLAGCPLEVCRTCGRPRERIVERDLVATRGIVRDGGPNQARHSDDDAGSNWGHSGGVYGRYETRTLGWSDCGHQDYRRGVVLDPFIGSGTTALVARNHGRHAIGIDLSAEYLAIAAKRLQQLSLLGGIA